MLIYGQVSHPQQHEQQTIRPGLIKCSAIIPNIIFQRKTAFNSISRDCSLEQQGKNVLIFQGMDRINVVLAADTHQGRSVSHSATHSGHLSKREGDKKEGITSRVDTKRASSPR